MTHPSPKLHRRAPLKRGGALKRTRLRPVSAKRRQQKPARRRCMEIVRERAFGLCELPGCCERGVDGHERLRRSQGGSFVDPANVVLLCRHHHDLVHANPAWAESVGLLRRGGAA